MKTLSLANDWRLLEQPLDVSARDFSDVLNTAEGWMEVPSVPCDVHTVLQACGRIKDPLVADNSFACEWIEDRSFWFCKRFYLPDPAPEAELVFEMLDLNADIILNGNLIGRQASAMYEFRRDVSAYLTPGENTVLIRLTTGLETVKESELAPVRDFVACEWRSRRPGRGDERRVMLRKPQYVFGWDQSPRLATCAIGGDARLEFPAPVTVRNIRFETLSLGEGGARILAEAEIENRDRLFGRDVTVGFSLELNGKTVHREERSVLAQCGNNYIDFGFTLKKPALWWPNGYGEQPLYTARVTASDENGVTDEKTLRVGVRTVKLDTGILNGEERLYRFLVNGKPIYCRGADFIMTDQIYASVTPDRQKKLLLAARDAHFCMLRFWDGNVYQSDEVYGLCDEYGILAVQNFCFACAAYPDHLEEFCREVEREAVYQIKRLRNHPSLALWIGNGENSTILYNYLNKRYFDSHDPVTHPGGTYIYNTLLPRIHRALCASVGYQCTTPFGYAGKTDSPVRGSRHYYPFLDLRPESRQYRISADSIDALSCRFIMEGGIMGPPSAEALVAYCGGRENTAYDSPVFLHHRNTFERDAVRDAVFRHYTGERELTLEEYCLYGGLFQADLLGYEADHVRSQKTCGGSLFWCFNDGFGEVGFSVTDHFGDPKPAYYALKRSYAPRRLILKKENGAITVFCTNSSPDAFSAVLRCGWVSLDGSDSSVRETEFTLPPFAPATPVATAEDAPDYTGHVVFASADGLDTATFRAADFKNYCMPGKAVLTLREISRGKDQLTFSVTSDRFAHAVRFGMKASARFSDQYFDLLPGESKTVTLFDPGDTGVDGLCPSCVLPSEKPTETP